MKKVVILSYFFPPCNLTASQRAYGWARFLNEFGYYPIIITRNWEVPINSPNDALKSSGKEVVIKKEKGYEVHYLPYKSSLRDVLAQKSNASIVVVFLRKLLTYLELFSQGRMNYFIPFKNIYSYANSFLKMNKVSCLVVTANPFVLFRFGYLLSKKYKVPWIADYRDDWSTSEINDKTGVLNKIIAFVEAKNEKRWLGSASLFTTISEYYRQKIGRFIGVKGKVLLNGFFEEDFTPVEPFHKGDIFEIVYNGTLYPSQNIEMFIEAVNQLLKEDVSKKIMVSFLGLAFDDEQVKRVQGLIRGFESSYRITKRIPRAQVLKTQQSAQLLLMVAHNNVKGIPSSKLYEYLGLRKPILLCGTDEDILSDTIGNYNLGHVAISMETIKTIINTELKLFHSAVDKTVEVDEAYVTKFTRFNQAKKLGVFIQEVENG